MGHLIGTDYCQEHLLEVAKSIVLAIHKGATDHGENGD